MARTNGTEVLIPGLARGLSGRETSNRVSWAPAIILVALIAGLSFFVAPSYDEVYWIAVVRKLANGGTLYDTVLDNKGPLWYPVVAMLDASPLTFEATRSLAIGLIGVSYVALSNMLLFRHGFAYRTRMILINLAFAWAVMTSLLHLSVELAVPTLILAVFAALPRSFMLSTVVMVCALLIDPRAILLVPGIAVYIRSIEKPGSSGSMGASTLAFVLVAFAVVGVYWIHPDLRFAVIELGAATRPTGLASPTFHVLVVLTATLPLLVSVLTVIRPRRLTLPNYGWWFLGGAILIPVVSVAPLTHYWGYLPVTLALLRPTQRAAGSHSGLWLAYLVLSFAPLLTLTFVVSQMNRAALETQSAAIDRLKSWLQEDDRVVILSLTPHATAELPVQTLNSSPVPQGELLQTSRQARYLHRLADNLAVADAVWIESPDGLASSPDRDSRLWKLLDGHDGRFPCRREVFPFAVLEAPHSIDTCPPD